MAGQSNPFAPLTYSALVPLKVIIIFVKAPPSHCLAPSIHGKVFPNKHIVTDKNHLIFTCSGFSDSVKHLCATLLVTKGIMLQIVILSQDPGPRIFTIVSDGQVQIRWAGLAWH